MAWLTRAVPSRGAEAEENLAAVEALDHALEMAERAGTAALAEVVRRQKGVLLGGERGKALVTTADAWLTSQGVVRPERLARCLLPGFDDMGGPDPAPA